MRSVNLLRLRFLGGRGSIGRPRRLSTATTSDSFDSAAKWRMAKFAVVGVPACIIGSLASLAVHSPDNRARIEPLFPEFVQFLRKNIGFDDEDPKERLRIHSLERFYEHDQVVVIKGESGETLLTKTVPGKMLFGELMSTLHAGLGGLSTKTVIEFEDGNSTASDGVPDRSIEEQVIDSHPNLTLQKSFWNIERKNSSTPEGLETAGNLEYLKLFCMFYPPNILSNRLQSLRDCKALPGLKEKTRAGIKNSRNDNIYIDETIQRLENTIRQLEKEKRTGSREIDQIEAELNMVKANISALKWKKWSFF